MTDEPYADVPPPAQAEQREPGGVDPGAAEPGGVDPGAVEPRRPEAPPHDPTGLDLARAVASGARATTPRRQGRPGRRTAQPPSELSGAHPDGRDPALIGQVVERIVRESGWSTDLAVHAVFARWASIVGSEVASHCTPVRFAEGHLHVQADSTAWATQLRLLAPTLVRRLNEELGHDTVLRIDVAGPTAPSWRRGSRSVRGGRGPRDTYG